VYFTYFSKFMLQHYKQKHNIRFQLMEKKTVLLR